LELATSAVVIGIDGFEKDKEVCRESVDTSNEQWKCVYKEHMTRFLFRNDSAKMKDLARKLWGFKLFHDAFSNKEVHSDEEEQESDGSGEYSPSDTVFSYMRNVWDSIRQNKDVMYNHLRLRRFLEMGRIPDTTLLSTQEEIWQNDNPEESDDEDTLGMEMNTAFDWIESQKKQFDRDLISYQKAMKNTRVSNACIVSKIEYYIMRWGTFTDLSRLRSYVQDYSENGKDPDSHLGGADVEFL
jgi:hypothetical protein